MRNRRTSWLCVATLCLLASVQSAFAHETHTYRIGNKTYQLTVGSLNEPVAIDDKTGFDFRVVMPSEKQGAEATPVSGLDQTLKVELAAGDKKKVFDIQPAFGAPGSYRTAFYPTVQTTMSYRVFGTIDSAPIDLTFTCNPAGHPRTPDDSTETKISDQVTRLSRRGAFGCPADKAALGFPEASPSLVELQTKISELNTAVADSRGQMDRARLFGLGGLILGGIGLVVGVGAWMASKKQHVSLGEKRPAARVKI